MFEKYGGRSSHCPCILHPDSSAPIVFMGGPKHPSFGAVLGKGLSPLGLVMDKRLHANWNKRFSIIVVWTIEVCIHADFWVAVCLSEETELALHLGDELAP